MSHLPQARLPKLDRRASRQRPHFYKASRLEACGMVVMVVCAILSIFTIAPV